jgi:hypothetical protein
MHVPKAMAGRTQIQQRPNLVYRLGRRSLSQFVVNVTALDGDAAIHALPLSFLLQCIVNGFRRAHDLLDTLARNTELPRYSGVCVSECVKLEHFPFLFFRDHVPIMHRS